MSPDPIRPDPVAEAIERATEGLPTDVTDAIRSEMADGLGEFDPTVVGPDDQAIEVSVALDVPPAQRLDAARRFAAERRAVTLGAESWRLLEAFARGDFSESAARALLGRVERALHAEQDPNVRQRLAEHAMECRWVLADGQGPTSVRAAKLRR